MVYWTRNWGIQCLLSKLETHCHKMIAYEMSGRGKHTPPTTKPPFITFMDMGKEFGFQVCSWFE